MNVIWYNKNNSGGIQINTVKDGYIYIDNLSEELDSATIVLMYQPKRNFESFDMMDLGSPINKMMLINDFVESKLNIDDDNSYEYTINLMSLTKELERITLPNISITKPKSGTSKTINTVIDELLLDYSPKYIHTTGVFYDIYSRLDGSNTRCPDMQMSRPTLRAALDRILSVDNCICYLNSNRQVRMLHLNARGNPITLTNKYNYQPENQSASDYATETENNYNNVVPSNNQYINDETVVTELIGFRTEDMILTDQNAVLMTQNPIYDIKEIKWCGTVKIPYNAMSVKKARVLYNGTYYDCSIDYDHIYYELDITPYILEEKDYNISTYETQKYRGFYSRGDNKIKGLLNYKKTAFQINNFITLKRIISHLMYYDGKNTVFFGDMKNAIVDSLTRQLPEGTTYNESLLGSVSIQTENGNLITDNYIEINKISNDTLVDNQSGRIKSSCMFKITYQAQNENIRMRSGKYLPETNANNILVDNPGEAYVDIKRQGELFNQKCNRLGNRVKYLNARFDSVSELPQLGDYLGDFVLIRRELQYYDDFILFKGTLTENYVNINYFTGINARKRTWNIVSAGEAFDKQLLDKNFCEFSFSPKYWYGSESINYLNGDFALRLLNVFHYDVAETYIKRCLLLNEYTQESGQFPYSYIELDLTSYVSGNSLIFNAKVDDNYSAGIYIASLDGGGAGNDLPVEQYAKYVDSNGFANQFYISLLDNTAEFISDHWGMPALTNGQKIPAAHGQSPYSAGDTFNVYLDTSRRKPKVFINNEPAMQTYHTFYTSWFKNHKDIRETLGFNIQFEFCSDTPDIILGKAFMERQQLVNRGGWTDTLVIYASWDTYKVSERDYKGDGVAIGSTNNLSWATISARQASLTINLPAGTGYNSLAICENVSGRLIMAINTGNRKAQDSNFNDHNFSIYLTMLRTRDRNKYTGPDMTSWQK